VFSSTINIPFSNLLKLIVVSEIAPKYDQNKEMFLQVNVFSSNYQQTDQAIVHVVLRTEYEKLKPNL